MSKTVEEPKVKKDGHGVEVKVGDCVAYSSYNDATVRIGEVIRLTPKKIVMKGSGAKDPRSTINISNHPQLIPNIMENYVAPFRHLTDDQIKTLVQMFNSSNTEDVELAFQLMDTYKAQANE